MTPPIPRPYAHPRLAIDVLIARDVRNTFGINLTDLVQADGSQLTDRMNDHEVLAGVLFIVCARQAKVRGLDAEAFIRSFDCDAIQSATTAIWGALCDFFPESKRRVLRVILAKTLERMKTPQPTDEQIETAVEAVLDKVLPITTGESSGSLPEFSASTQAT